MSLQLFLGSAGSGKSYQLYREVIEESRKNPGTNYLVIVPEQFTLQTQKDIVTMHPEHGVMNVDILSFLRFAYRIFEEVGGDDYPILEDTGKSMVLRKVVAEKRKDLILFGTNVKKTGFINELKSLLSELYQYNISEEDFEKMQEVAGKKPVLKAKLADLHTVYEGFRGFMKERYITAEEIFLVLNRVIDRSEWIKGTVICLDGFTGFTPSQYQLLSKMLKYAKKVMVTVTLDPREMIGQEGKEHQLFGLSHKTIKKLYQLAEDSKTVIEEPVYAESRSGTKVPYRFRKSEALAALEQNLFRYPYETYGKEQWDIRIHSTRDRSCEVAFVAREIKRLVREEGLRYRDIAVVTGDVKEYGRIAKRLFLQSGIPCFIDYKKDILSNPFVELLRAAVVVVSEDFSYEGVFRYLRSGMTGCTKEEIDILENYVLATGIRGHKRWAEPFVRRYRSRQPLQLDAINEIRAKFMEEIEPLYVVLKDREKTLRDYTMALYELGVNLKLEQKLEEYRRGFIEAGQPLVAKEFEQVYRIVMDLYDQMVLLLGDEHCSLKEFSEILDTGFVEVKVGLIPPGVDEVVVGDTQRTRLKDIRALFFIGVNEGIVPKAIGSGGILSDIERELLINNDIELAPTKRQQAFTDQFYIYLNMTKPKEKLYITYHKVNEEGKSVNPSFIINKVKQLFPKLSVIDESDAGEDIERVLRDDGLNYLAEGLRSYNRRETSDLWRELYLYYREDSGRRKILDRLVEGAFFVNTERGISKAAAKLLYGSELKGSVTRLEKYAGCAFAHFLAYGLSLEQRQEYKLAVPDIGTIFHNAIDHFSKRLDTGDYTWHTIPEDIREQWAIESVAYAVEQYESSVLRSSARNEYMIKRMERITVRTLWALCNQIKQGAFEPWGYEKQFNHVPDVMLSLTGRIDRLDIYEEADRVYVRVIDYKSGNTYFDLSSVYYGLQQQLSVYLSAALDYLNREYGGKEIVPAGIFYYHIDDPIVAKSDQAEEDIYKSLRMNGLVNEDKRVIGLMDSKLAGEEGRLRASAKSDIIPVETNKEGELGKRSIVATEKQLKALIDYVNAKLAEDSKQILQGASGLNPYRMGEEMACTYCEYRGACGFDSRLPGYSYRNLSKKPADEIKAEIWGECEENF
ncbi:MAG TPA: helicase-exonuclease AddAB subunit AddB [Clostridiales bacterium]|nr:helicase-exonuclease AddAB subunit AddB [Clostridiales bacterium]